MKYPFKMEPYAHQLVAIQRGWEREEYGYFMEMGTGKSMVAIVTAAMLHDAGKITGMLVVAPKGVYRNWSDKEIPQHMPDHVPLRVAVWRNPLTKKVKEKINDLFVPNDDLNILVINIDALITKNGNMVCEKFLRSRNVLFIMDESTLIKNAGAQRTQAAIKLGELARYRRILTGSPVTKSPLDIYSQCAFLDPHLLGFTSFYTFKNHYADLETVRLSGHSFMKVTGYKNTDELRDSLKSFTYRVTKDECLDLPDKIFLRREFDMTKEQKKVYKQMKEDALAFLEGGEALSSTSVLTQLLRLHQISCGHFPTDDGEVFPLKHNRLRELVETIEETGGKVIIWANYRADIFLILAELNKLYPGQTVTYFGDTKDDDRQLAVQSFQDPDSNIRFFLGNTQTGGYGITLTEASTVVYYSNNYDLEKRLQSEDRAHRIGLEHAVTYIDLVCRGTIDERIIDALRNKISLANSITGDAWKEWI